MPKGRLGKTYQSWKRKQINQQKQRAVGTRAVFTRRVGGGDFGRREVELIRIVERREVVQRSMARLENDILPAAIKAKKAASHSLNRGRSVQGKAGIEKRSKSARAEAACWPT